MLQIITALALPLLDRMRGDGYPPIPRPIIKALMGAAVLFTLLGTFAVEWKLLAIVIIGHMVGESIGWGVAIGSGLAKVTKNEWDIAKLGTQERKTEWYLKIPVINYSWQTALIFRGMLWALIPSAGLYHYFSIEAAAIMLFSHAIAMVSGIYMARWLKGKDDQVMKIISKLSFTKFTAEDRWACQEVYRGIVIAGILGFASRLL